MKQTETQHADRQTTRVKTIRWLLLFMLGTVAACLLTFVVPYDEATEFLVYTTKFWLHDRFPNSISAWPTPLKITSGLFAGTDTDVEDVVTLGVTAGYFGIIGALIGSRNKKQFHVGIGLAIIYLGGTCYVIYLRILSLA